MATRRIAKGGAANGAALPGLPATPPPPAPYVFVTVGTTKFDAMVAAALSPAFVAAVRGLGVSRVVLQLGRGAVPAVDGLVVPAADAARLSAQLDAAPAGTTVSLHPVSAAVDDGGGFAYELYRVKPSIDADVAGAALVVSHAGAGSVFEALRAGRPLVVCVNDALADNHQVELADAMAAARHCAACDPGRLATTVAAEGPALVARGGPAVPLPPLDRGRFLAALDEAAGFRA
jgi:beta-1,4-N-acetylglucosaminyltransferase